MNTALIYHSVHNIYIHIYQQSYSNVGLLLSSLYRRTCITMFYDYDMTHLRQPFGELFTLLGRILWILIFNIVFILY